MADIGDVIRLKKALQLALWQLETGQVFNISTDAYVTVTEQMLIDRLPDLYRFLKGIIDNSLPGFNEYIKADLKAYGSQKQSLDT